MLGAAVGGPLALAAGARALALQQPGASEGGVSDRPTLIGSRNALGGMKLHYQTLVEGADPLDVAIEVVKVQEADPADNSVGIGGLPNEDGVVQLDAAVMHGPTHNSGAVACIENILHPSEVARLVMERTDHCLLVGRGAYEFAISHGHKHIDLLTEESRKAWMEWKETMSDRYDRLQPAPERKQSKLLRINGEDVAARDLFGPLRPTGTVHCSALAKNGDLACTTTTSGLAFKIPGRVGDSPIIGAGLYCDMEAGSAGATGRGEMAILANASFALVELLRKGAKPLDAGMEVLQRIVRQTQRATKWQKELVGEDGLPASSITFYVLARDGSHAGVQLKGKGQYAVADAERGPRLEPVVSLYP